MTFFHILVEGGADVPMVREIMTRRFSLVEEEGFKIYPHKGIGTLPKNPLATPDPKRRGLLDQLPAKLKGFSFHVEDICVVVLVDVDDKACKDFLAELNNMLSVLPKRPPRVLFRLAIEETESWFIADKDAVKKAYSNANLESLRRIKPDAIVGAWERLAESIGVKVSEGAAGPVKYSWAENIAPHINLENPISPSLGKFISGIERELKTPCQHS
jgi:hypothetical protein